MTATRRGTKPARRSTPRQLLAAAERALPGLRQAAGLVLPGTPVTFQRFTRRKGLGGWFSADRPAASLGTAAGARPVDGRRQHFPGAIGRRGCAGRAARGRDHLTLAGAARCLKRQRNGGRPHEYRCMVGAARPAPGDNQALAAALRQAGQVLPVFVLDPQLLSSPYSGEKRLAFLFAGLRSLDEDLRRRGSYLAVRRGDPAQVLSDLLRETGAEAVFAEADFSPFARRRDQRAAAALPLRLSTGLTVHAPAGRRQGRWITLHRVHALQQGLAGPALARQPAARTGAHCLPTRHSP